jgi:hypothetical protein
MSMIKFSIVFQVNILLVQIFKRRYVNNTTLVMVAVLATVARLSAAVVVRIEQASAQDTIFTFKQKTVKHVQWPYNL